MLSERSKRQERRQQLLGVRSQGNFLWRALHEGLLRANYLFADHTRNALILAVFGFRVSPANPDCPVWASKSRAAAMCLQQSHLMSRQISTATCLCTVSAFRITESNVLELYSTLWRTASGCKFVLI